MEATERPGAMISARHAGEQGREAFSVPRRVDSRTSHECHRLIRDEAKLVETIDDILKEFGPLVETTPGEGAEVIHHPGLPVDQHLNAL